MTRWMGSPAYRGRTSTRGACWAWTRRLRGPGTTRDQELIDTCASQDETSFGYMRVGMKHVPIESISPSDIALALNPCPSFPWLEGDAEN